MGNLGGGSAAVAAVANKSMAGQYRRANDFILVSLLLRPAAGLTAGMKRLGPGFRGKSVSYFIGCQAQRYKFRLSV